MITRQNAPKKVLLHLLKDFSRTHTITFLATEFGLSRVGVWKILKKLENERYIHLKAVGNGKTSASLITLNWENPLVEKALSLYLTEEAMRQRRWQVNFAELERVVDFFILYGSIIHSPNEAADIDIIGISQRKNFVKIQKINDTIQKVQSKTVHAINFTEGEFKAELLKSNHAFLEAVKKGTILFGQENFVRFMKAISK